MNAATKTHIACDNSQKIRVFVGEGGWRERGKRERLFHAFTISRLVIGCWMASLMFLLLLNRRHELWGGHLCPPLHRAQKKTRVTGCPCLVGTLLVTDMKTGEMRQEMRVIGCSFLFLHEWKLLHVFFCLFLHEQDASYCAFYCVFCQFLHERKLWVIGCSLLLIFVWMRDAGQLLAIVLALTREVSFLLSFFFYEKRLDVPGF